MAITATYFTTATVTTTATPYTIGSSYNRDLVITAGTANIYVALGAATSAVTTSSFLIPAGQSVCLMGAAPTTAVVYTCIATSGGTSSVSLGWGSVVSVI